MVDCCLTSFCFNCISDVEKQDETLGYCRNEITGVNALFSSSAS